MAQHNHRQMGLTITQKWDDQHAITELKYRSHDGRSGTINIDGLHDVQLIWGQLQDAMIRVSKHGALF